MREPFVIFGVAPRATAIVSAVMQQWSHEKHPTQHCTSHLFLDMLNARGMTYVCRLLGMITLGLLSVGHKEVIDKYDLILPTPVGDERFDKDIDSNVQRLTIDDGIRPRHLAVGLSESALMLNIATREADRTSEVGHFIPFAELHALGAEAASIAVGDFILRTLIKLHPDAFAPFPNLCDR